MGALICILLPSVQVAMRVIMRSTRLLVALLLLTSIAVYSVIQYNCLNQQSAFNTPADVVEDLKQQIKQAETEAEVEQLYAALHKVREKEARKAVRQEIPGAFMEALAMLKTTRSGETYRPNYKMRAMAEAHARFAGKHNDELPWTERGPGNVSGRARAVIADVSDETGATWFAATIGGGIWKTTDKGATWENKSPEMNTLTTTSIVQSFSNPEILYAGTGMGYGRVVDLEGSGIFKSEDGGETWVQLESTANGELLEAINRIVVDPENPDIVVVCSNNSFSHLGVEEGGRQSGIFRSTDGGDSWTQVFDPEDLFGTNTDNRVQQIVADPTDFNNLYASVNEVGVVKSVDGGQTWTTSADNFALPSDVGNPSSGGFGLAGISVRTELAVAPSDPNRIYAAVERPRGVADLYMSQDAGTSWTLVNDTGNDPNWFNANSQSGATGAYTAGWFDNTIAVHPFDENTVYVGGVNLYRLTVDPVTSTRASAPMAWWIPNSAGIPVVHADHHFLSIIEGENGGFTILNANDGGVAFSEDGGSSWTSRAGMITSQFYGVDKMPGGQAYIGGTQDNGSWVSGENPDTNAPWRFVIGGDGFEAVWNYRDPNLLLGGSQFNGLRRSEDGGQTWSQVSVAPVGFGPFITKIANSKADPDLVFAIGSNGVMRSDNFGKTWTLTPVASNWIGYRPFDNVEVSNADPQVVWISSRLDVDPPSGIQGGIHVSADGGLSFNDLSGNFPSFLREASGIATDPIDPNTAYMLFAGPSEPKVLRTRDLGQTWEDLSGFNAPSKNGPEISSNGFPDVAVFSLLVMPFDTQILWAGTEIGLFVSEDDGATWTPADNGFPAAAIFELSIVDDEILVATQGRGIWTVKLPELEGYTPPVATLSPRLRSLAMLPSGMLGIDVGLPSAYDSTLVMEGENILRIAANEASMDTTLLIPVMEDKIVTYSVVSYKDGRSFASAPQSVEAFAAIAQYNYANDFAAQDAEEDFIGSGFQVASVDGFDSPAIHSDHPYGQASDFTYTLKTPIIVGPSDALITYDDVVLIEEGLVADYTNPNFFDYVIVEGTKDGLTWLPLLPGYDSSADPNWSQAYRAGLTSGSFDSSTLGDASMFVSHTINLLDTFEAGETVFLRFRLHSDPLAVAWGWAIDNLVIQPNVVTTEPIPGAMTAELGENYPNPFRTSTTIPFTLDADRQVTVSIFDIQGRKVRDLVTNEIRNAGDHQVEFSPGELASGTYFYRFTARPLAGRGAPVVQTKSMTITR